MSPDTASLVKGKRLATAVYALQAAAPFVGITYPVGAVISYLQRPKLSGTWLESHFQWQINTFWLSLGIGALGALALTAGPVGTMILTGDLMWLVYRIVQGWTRLSAGKPVGSAATAPAKPD